MTKNNNYFDLIVIGGGAAGFFGSIIACEQKRRLSVLILEKTSKLLSKVKVSGGGRCNVTHHCFDASPLAKHYPRGSKELKTLFRKFQVRDMMNWLAEKNVKLKTETDGRMFPVTDNSQTIIDCFLREAERYHIQIKMNSEVTQANVSEKGFDILTSNGSRYTAKKVLVATGGYNNKLSYQWINDTGHIVTNPIPSLFTFNDSEKKFSDLMGISMPQAEVKIVGTKFSQQGPVLITHWGLSGPAVIRLSAWAAEYLYQQKYIFTVLVNWIGLTEEELRSRFTSIKEQQARQQLLTNPLFNLPSRLWQRLCELAEIPETKIWGELSNKHLFKLMEYLIRCPFQIKGKTTFKEEFVTCGGVVLSSINLDTKESNHTKGLYFAGEVLNIDGETGGFNFQSAWTTAWVAAQSISR